MLPARCFSFYRFLFDLIVGLAVVISSRSLRISGVDEFVLQLTTATWTLRRFSTTILWFCAQPADASNDFSLDNHTMRPMRTGMQLLAMALSRIMRTLLLIFLCGYLALWMVRNFLPPPSATLASRFADQSQRAALDHALSGGAPIVQSFVAVVRNYAAGDFGRSYVDQRHVADELQSRLALSVLLLLPGALLAHLCALFAARSACWRWLSQGSLASGALLCAALVQILLSSPQALNLVPVLGFDQSLRSLSWTHYGTLLIAPSLAITLSAFGVLYPIYRSAWLSANADASIRSMAALGLSKTAQAWQRFRLMRTALIAWLLLSVPLLILGGGIVFESMFHMPGLGRWLQTAALNADAPVLLAVSMFACACIAGCQLLSDALAWLLDPRQRSGQ
jgi:peptide/nickel transport system permease protein